MPQEITKDVISSYHLYVVRLKLDNSSKNQQQVYTGLESRVWALTFIIFQFTVIHTIDVLVFQKGIVMKLRVTFVKR